jgi:hypothetical protein
MADAITFGGAPVVHHSKFGGQCLRRVNPEIEHIWSGLPQIATVNADIA